MASFLSQSNSSSTLIEGLKLARAPDMSVETDPDPAAMRAEVNRLCAGSDAEAAEIQAEIDRLEAL